MSILRGFMSKEKSANNNQEDVERYVVNFVQGRVFTENIDEEIVVLIINEILENIHGRGNMPTDEEIEQLLRNTLETFNISLPNSRGEAPFGQLMVQYWGAEEEEEGNHLDLQAQESIEFVAGITSDAVTRTDSYRHQLNLRGSQNDVADVAGGDDVNQVVMHQLNPEASNNNTANQVVVDEVQQATQDSMVIGHAYMTYGVS